jgi:putative ATP-dependent endonuclease of the OLD family
MKLNELRIHNYRSVADEVFRTSDYSLLIGPNNSGKSNVIDALRTFYEKELKFEPTRDLPKFETADSESWVEVEYLLSPEEAATIKPEYLIDGRRFRVRKWFFPADRAKEGIFGYENGNLSSSLFYGWKNVGQGKLGNVIYVPAVSRLEEHTKLSGPSALRDLINDILKPIIRSSKAFSELSEHFATFGKTIKTEETPDRRSLAGLEDRINEEIADWGAAFSFEVNCPQDDDIVKSLIRHTFANPDLNEPMDASSFGHGFQRHLIYTVLRISATYVSRRPEPKKKEFQPDLELLLFEEPEAFLHPPQQNLLDSSLRTLAATPHHQVLAATHSPQFVSNNTDDIADLIRLCKDGPRTRASQVSKAHLKGMFEDNQKIRDLLGEPTNVFTAEEEVELENIRHFLWLNPERCCMFFSDLVLVVEGLSEQVLINYLIRTGLTKIPKSVYVLDALGKYNIHRFINLLSALRIRHAVLHDLDQRKTGKPKAVQDAVNNLIAASRTETTIAVDSLPDNLESYLDVAIVNERWKPSELLFAVKSGRVRPERLHDFVAKVEALLTTGASEAVSGETQLATLGAH